MEKFTRKKEDLGVHKLIEQKPFKNPAVRSFFEFWCDANDDIKPQVISREEWEKKKIVGVLEKTADEKQILFVPEDLQLWEMIGIIEAIDKDTFFRKPEEKLKSKEKLLKLGKIFKNTAVYIASRINSINNGKEIAEALTEEFYRYGDFIINGGLNKEGKNQYSFEEIVSQKITEKETKEVDKFLAGESLYKTRKSKIDKKLKSAGIESERLYKFELELARRKALAQFFSAAEKAFLLEHEDEKGNLKKLDYNLYPWQNKSPIHSEFLKKVKRAIKEKIELPQTELKDAIFRRGLERMLMEIKEYNWKTAVNKFFKRLGIDLEIKEKKLFEALEIYKLKNELEDIRKTGDVKNIVKKEREIADKIQKAVSKFPGFSDGDNPRKIIESRFINCVGSSILGGVLMKEAGLNYLVACVPEHSVLLLVTADGDVEWRDMTETFFNQKIYDFMIEGVKKDGTQIKVKDLVKFSKNPTPEGLLFYAKNWYGERGLEIMGMEDIPERFIVVFGPEYGQELQLLNNIAIRFCEEGKYEESLEACRQASVFNHKYVYIYHNLGETFLALGNFKEAVEVFKKAVKTDPKFPDSYVGLGNAFIGLGKIKDAIESYKKFCKMEKISRRPEEYVERVRQKINELEKLL